jgi:hypothetical protein
LLKGDGLNILQLVMGQFDQSCFVLALVRLQPLKENVVVVLLTQKSVTHDPCVR